MKKKILLLPLFFLIAAVAADVPAQTRASYITTWKFTTKRPGVGNVIVEDAPRNMAETSVPLPADFPWTCTKTVPVLDSATNEFYSGFKCGNSGLSTVSVTASCSTTKQDRDFARAAVNFRNPSLVEQSVVLSVSCETFVVLENPVGKPTGR